MSQGLNRPDDVYCQYVRMILLFADQAFYQGTTTDRDRTDETN